VAGEEPETSAVIHMAAHPGRADAAAPDEAADERAQEVPA